MVGKIPAPGPLGGESAQCGRKKHIKAKCRENGLECRLGDMTIVQSIFQHFDVYMQKNIC